MKAIYENADYAERNPTWHEEDSPWKARHIASIIRDNAVKFKTLCEVGCGTGDILLNLKHEFPHADFTGYEISPHAFARAQMKEKESVEFKLGDFTKDCSNFYDVIVIADVIEHVEDYVSFIKSLKDRSGLKIFHIPLDLSVQSVLRSWPILKLRENVGHLHYFYKDTALATLRDCGYTILDHRYTASRLELPNQAFSSRLMRWPRRLVHAVNPDFAVRLLGGYSLLVLAR